MRNALRCLGILALALVLAAPAAVCSAQGLAGGFQAFASDDPQNSATLTSAMFRDPENAATAPAAGNPFQEEAAPETPALGGGSAFSQLCGDSCGDCDCDASCGRLAADCVDCPSRGLVLSAGVESWRQIPDGSYQNNGGALFGANLGFAIPRLRDWGIGGQLGVSYGIYDWNGRVSSATERAAAQEQIFVTAGLFRRAYEGSPISAAIAYDWMINDNYGVLASEPFLGQWRAQIGYALSARNEIGVWGALDDRGDSQNSVSLLRFKPLSQVNLFWHHNFESGADSWLWIGAPEHGKLGGRGSLGDLILGAALTVPLSDRVALYGNAQYMNPTASASQTASVESAYNIGFGLNFHFGGKARNSTVAGHCWTPYLPVANNASFLTDTNVTY